MKTKREEARKVAQNEVAPPLFTFSAFDDEEAFRFFSLFSFSPLPLSFSAPRLKQQCREDTTPLTSPLGGTPMEAAAAAGRG